MAVDLDRPIFFIGMPRSGTTVSFASFATHPELGWFSTYQEVLPRVPVVALFSRLNELPGMAGFSRGGNRRGNRGGVYKLNFILPRPSEPYAVWRVHCGDKFLYDYLLNLDATPKEAEGMRNVTRRTLTWQGKRRLTTKLTGPGRIQYTRSIFPDGMFIHVIRDGRAVVNSLMNHHSWVTQGGATEPWWQNGLTEADLREWKEEGRGSPEALAAVQWKRVVETTRQEAKMLAPGQYTEFHYEEFVRDPVALCHRLYQFCGLESSEETVGQYTDQSDVRSMNYKYRQAFGEDKVAVLNRIMGDTLRAVGYELD